MTRSSARAAVGILRVAAPADAAAAPGGRDAVRVEFEDAAEHPRGDDE